jgi:hypothetical protein
MVNFADVAIRTCILCVLSVGFSGFAQQTPQNTPPFGLYVPQDHRPALFFREDFKAPPKGLQELPVTQAYVENPNLELKLYGPGKELVFIDHHAGEPKDDPNFIWTGLTPGPWGLALKDKNNYVDLSGLGRIKWRTQQTGFHQVRPILKLANGTWIVGEYAEGWTPDWHESEFWPAEMRWRRLNADKMLEERMTTSPGENGAWEKNPDLSKIDEVGFTDLMGGSGHGQGGWSRIDWIEVYGVPVKREAVTENLTKAPAVIASAAAPPPPVKAQPLLFREDFKAPPPGINELAITQAFIANPNLELKLYGPGKDLVYIDRAENTTNDPNWGFIWTGVTPGPWAVALKEKNSYVNLTGLAKVRWRVKEMGFHQLHPILKLADGTWLVGEYKESWTPDWHEGEFWPSYVRWRKLDVNKMVEAPTGNRYENGRWEENPDLSKVDEIGFSDMMGGSGHGSGGWSRIDWIEVYGAPVKR